MKFYLSNANKGTILNAILKQCEGFIMLHEYTYRYIVSIVVNEEFAFDIFISRP